MDPPLVNEAPFSATDNPSSYSFSELLSFPMSGRGVSGLRTDGLAEESTVTQHSGSHGRNGGEKRKRDDGNSFYDDSSKLVSSCTANSDLNKSNMQTKAPRVRDENGELKNENSGTNVKQEEKSKHEPPKDYIHVRARRGQATDSHSLAERVRREKISERMKLLQDLVPGCNKVTGKALMLDEIINYVQSLQRQVEFLSMKLASVNPGQDFNMENLLSKETFQQNATLPQQIYPLDSSTPAFLNHQPHQIPQLLLNNNASSRPLTQNLSLDGFDFPEFGEGDLHSIFQMGFGQNPVNFPVPIPNQTSNMKIER